jgi:hypothetical protein
MSIRSTRLVTILSIVSAAGTLHYGLGRYSGSLSALAEDPNAGIGAGRLVLTQNPEALTVCPGSSATFTVAATGERSISYAWYKDGAALVDGNDLAGATGASLTSGSGWGTAYVLSQEVFPRVEGNTFEARVTPLVSGYMVWGLKDTGTGYSDGYFPYAFYFHPNGELRIYEGGAHRSTPGTYANGDEYGLRIELKPGTGARYWWSPPGDT